MGPQTEAAEQMHQMKYREEGEQFRDCISRVSLALRDETPGDPHYHALRDILGEQRFIPGGRIQASAGSLKNSTCYNCFVAPTMVDSFIDGDNCIMDIAKKAAATMRMGGGIGYDFSTLRPRGHMIKKLMSSASGPVSFMNIFNAVCGTIASAGHRRGAQMAMLRVDHPDIVEFVNCKHDNSSLTGFNVSVAVTDEFMEALYAKKTFQLKFGGVNYQEIDAEALWEKIMRSTWDWAEPGVVYIDRINQMNNLAYCETIAATNPCGEQPLPPNGACLLGSFNLTKYLTRQIVSVSDLQNGKPHAGWHLDLSRLESDVPAVVRAMDNVVDRSHYPLAEQKLEAQNKRRMGLGVLGLANALEALGMPYGSPEFLEKQDEVLGRLLNACYKASANLAKEKGAFPLFDSEKYLQSKFLSSGVIDPETLVLIKQHGIRNSHVTSIAPTGTISLTADNTSSGVEPVFALEIDRPINTPTGKVKVKVKDYGYQFLGVKGKTSSEVTVAEHLAVLKVAQKNVDSAVSKTCNLTGSTPWADFKRIYTDAYDGGCKGVTTFNSDGNRIALLEAKGDNAVKAAPEETQACFIDGATGRRECA